jgi:hypothetical protein
MKPLLDQVGLDDVLDGIARLGQRRRRWSRRRPARRRKFCGDHREIAAVELVEAERVDVEPAQRLVGDLARSTRSAPATEAKSRTRRSSRPAMRGVPRARRAISLAPSSGSSADAEHAGAAP